MVEIISHSPAQTQKIGTNLGKMAGPGDLFLLSGQLGAGKTCFTQGIAIGLSIMDYVSSPTFVLVKEYKGRIPLYHIDFYRLDNITDLIDLGLDDYIYGSGVCVIEWAEKGLPILPGECLGLKLEYLSDNERKLTFEAGSDRYLKLIDELKKQEY